jgi:hypothetical protein
MQGKIDINRDGFVPPQTQGEGTSPLQYFPGVLKWGVFFILIGFFFNCGMKRPKDEIGPLKKVISRFERGVINENRIILDSVYSKKDINRDSLISSVLQEFSALKSKGFYSFKRRKFSIIENKKIATVELFISREDQKSASGSVGEEKILEVFLEKKRDEWKIVGQDIK